MSGGGPSAAVSGAPATGPHDDAGVPAFWRALGLRGAIDLHVHFMPERVLRKVWAFFDGVDVDGAPWAIRYRGDESAPLRTGKGEVTRIYATAFQPALARPCLHTLAAG